MQNLWWLILWGLLLSSSPAAEVVRVVTWNLAWFPGGKPVASQQEQDRHFLEVATAVAQMRADVLILQEVRNDEAAERLARGLPGFQVHVTSGFKDSFSGALGEQQISILSRFPADAAWAEPWARGWANAPRGYAYAKVLVAGKPLHLYGLHLKSNLGNPQANTSKREDAMQQLLSHIRTQIPTKERVIVAGDFNTSKEQQNLANDNTLELIEQAGFFWTFEGIPLAQRITIPRKGSYPDACFDHIYTRHLARPAATVLSAAGSDHRPVVLNVVIE